METIEGTPGPAGAATMKMLLVDDKAGFCRVLKRRMEAFGFEVRVAHSARDALGLCAADPPGYAVVDLWMGGPVGLALIEALKARVPEMRIVMLTGYASVATATEAIRRGATHYLTKPATAEEILSALHKVEGNEDQEVSGELLPVEELKWEHFQRVLLAHGGDLNAAARVMGMHRRTLERWLARRTQEIWKRARSEE